MKQGIRRALAASTAVATALAGTVLLTATAPAHAERTVTNPTLEDYGFSARAFGTVARVDALGVKSGRTAPSYIGCTRRTGVHDVNSVAAVGEDEQISQAINIGAIRNVTDTFKDGPRVGTIARSTIADLRLGMLNDGDTVNPHILIRGLTTTARAWVNKRTDKFDGDAKFGTIEIIPRTGTPLDDVLEQVGGGINGLIEIITDPVLEAEAEQNGTRPDRVLTIPGLGEIALGNSTVNKKKRVIKSGAVALRVTLFGPDMTENTEDDVEVKVGRSRAFVYRDVPGGIMRGSAHPVEAEILGGILTVGRIIHKPLPCNGTEGKVETDAIADANLGNADMLEIAAARAEVFGLQKDSGAAKAWTLARVGRISIGGAEGLTINGPIVGKATVRTNRRGQIVQRSIKGSTLGEVLVGGESQGQFGPGDVETFEIPGGVLKIEFFVRDQSNRGLKVTALRLTLLEAGGDEIKSVVNLGVARAYITRK